MQLNQTWCNWPTNPIGLIEVIGGSYLSASPQISYKYLLESLEKKRLAIHAWSYIPSIDHQTQANQAWKHFRFCKKILEKEKGLKLKTIRIGHSLGCKLHLIAPDNGRNSDALISFAFNNFNANKSIPIVGKLSSKLNFETEFSPSTQETMKLIYQQYIQPNNLVINFSNDKFDQSQILLNCLIKRIKDSSSNLKLNGDHLTPVSFGLSKRLLGELTTKTKRSINLNALIDHIYSFILDLLSS